MALTGKDKNKISGLFKVDPKIKALTQKLTSIIEAERSIRISELLLVQLLAVQLHLHYEAVQDVLTNGTQIHSENRDGPVIKENPSCRMISNTSIQVIKLCSSLGITETDYQKITGILDEEDEEDPIKAFMESLNNKE